MNVCPNCGIFIFLDWEKCPNCKVLTIPVPFREPNPSSRQVEKKDEGKGIDVHSDKAGI